MYWQCHHFFVSSTFDCFNIICKQYHNTTLNPFLNGTENGDIDSTLNGPSLGDEESVSVDGAITLTRRHTVLDVSVLPRGVPTVLCRF